MADLFASLVIKCSIVCSTGSVHARSRRRTSVHAEMKTRSLRVLFVHGVYELVLARSCLFTTCTIVIAPRISHGGSDVFFNTQLSLVFRGYLYAQKHHKA